MYFESLLLCILYNLSCGINSKAPRCKGISCRKVKTATLEISQCCSTCCINKFEQIKYPFLIFISLSLNK